MLASPTHRAAVAFLRGGLLAIVALLAAPRAAALLQASGWLAPVARPAAALLPVAGFAAAAAFGAGSLGRGARGVRGFAVGGAASGLLMGAAWPELAGLTGREPLVPLLTFAVTAWAVAFGAGGAVAAALIERAAIPSVATGFTLGGVLGAAIFVAPSLATSIGYAGWPALARLVVATLTSVAGLLTPFAVGGAVAGKRMGRDD